jgi:hypothetical protein
MALNPARPTSLCYRIIEIAEEPISRLSRNLDDEEWILSLIRLSGLIALDL